MKSSVKGKKTWVIGVNDEAEEPFWKLIFDAAMQALPILGIDALVTFLIFVFVEKVLNVPVISIVSFKVFYLEFSVVFCIIGICLVIMRFHYIIRRINSR